MRIKLVNKGSLVVDCRDAMEGGKRWTLVDNRTRKREDFQAAGEIVSRIRDEADARAYIDELAGIRAKEEAENAKHRAWVFFADKVSAPTLLNLLDASGYVTGWSVKGVGDVLDSGVVRIDYKSDRQLLFQEGGSAVFRSPADDGKEVDTMKE